MNVTLMSHSKSSAMIGEDFEFNYADVYARILKAKNALPQSNDTQKIAIFAENSPQWIFALYGAWLNGATVVPVDAMSNQEDVAFVLSDCTPDAICVSKNNLETATKAVELSKQNTRIILLEELFDGEIQPVHEDWKINRDTDELALIVYTSGTTGNPKGVMLTFQNLYANMQAVCDAGYYFRHIRVLIMLPFHHILPIMGTIIVPLFMNAKLVFPKSISPVDISEILQKYPVDIIVSVPRFYEMVHSNIMLKIKKSKIATLLFNLAKLVNNKTFSRKLFGSIHNKFGGAVKYWISGGAALDKLAWQDLTTLGFTIGEGYGMTECAPIITFPKPDNIRIGSPGQALKGIEIRIIDGEVVVRGGNVTKGYYKRPEETAESIKNGWLYTGDLGVLDSDGFLHITGRRKEIIVLPNGKNLNPVEMEMQIKRQKDEDVLEVGVLMYDNTLQAIVRVDSALAEKLGAEETQNYIRNNVILPYNRSTATYKRIIKFIATTEDLPRTRVGKLKRHHLPAYIESDSNSHLKTKSDPEPTTQTYIELKEVIADQISQKVRPDAHMEMDLGLDSLGKISVQCFIKENYGVDVAERDFEKYSTLREFAMQVDKNRDDSFENTSKNVTWSDIIDTKPYPVLKKPHCLHSISISILKTLTKTLYNIDFSGLDNISKDKAMIIAPNHQSYIDGMMVFLPFSKQQSYDTFFFAKLRSIIKSGIIRKFADNSNVIIMDINDNVSESIRKLAQALRENKRVMIFPEGTRTKDGDIAEFKQSFAIIAKEMNIPVVPVCITGAYEAIKANGTFPKFGAKIHIEYLAEMLPETEESYKDFCTRVKNEVQIAFDKNTKK